MRKIVSILLILCLFLPAAALADEGDHVSGENLLYNPEFTDSSDLLPLPVGWTLSAYDLNDSSVTTGLSVEEDGSVSVRLSNLIGNDARICQDVEVSADTVYRLRAYVKTESVSGGQGATLSIDNYSIDGCFCYSQPLTGTTDWTELSLYVLTGAQQTTMRVALRLGGYGMESSGTAWFSGVSLYACDDVASGTVIDLASAKGASSSGETAPEEPASGEKSLFAPIVLCSLAVLVALGVLYVHALRNEADGLGNPANRTASIWGVVAAAVLLRLALSLVFVGHITDINCFMAWGNAVVTGGTSNFYTSGMFADYPPGYMYVCGALSWLSGLLGFPYGSAGMVFLFKLPGTIADLVSAYLIYRIARRQGIREIFALILLGLVALNPAAMFISGAWGQIDSVLTLGIVAACYLLLSGRYELSGAVYGLAILLKPQALMFGPLLAVAFLTQVFSGPDWKKRLVRTVLAVLAALAVLLVLSLPFRGTQDFWWLIGKYFATATSYDYASIEAFNFPSLLGLNWKPTDTEVLGVSYRVWGTAGIVLAVALGAVLYVYAVRRAGKQLPPAGERGALPSAGAEPRRPGALYLSAACSLAMMFTFGHYMHERYLFPALLLLLMAYLYERDRRILFSFCGISVALLLNATFAMYIVDHQSLRGAAYDVVTFAGSAFEVVNFLYLLWISVDILIRDHICKPLPASDRARPLPKLPTDNRLRYTRKDYVLLLGLTLVYGIVALTNLGTLSAPQTYWAPETPGETVTVSFPEETTVAEYWVYGNIANGGTMLLRAEDGHEESYEQLYDNMFRWHRVETWFTTRTVELQLYSGALKINEIAFFDEDGNRIRAQVVNPVGSQAALLDEQDTVPDSPSYFNGMYFDELYHARTAYEHLHNLSPYENSHPPLGKLIIAIGIAIFGMTPFGWRIMGALVGIAMLPVLYAFGKRLFRKTEYAFLCTALFAFDFMHFTQTRIATIDVYAVFFILLMYYYMYQYITMNFYVDELKKTLRPLALSGLFFGLGAASKWTCFYAGGGLALLFFGSLIARFIDRRRALANGTARERDLVATFWKNTCLTLLWCCLWFLLVPVLIYFGSYLPYYIYEAGQTQGYGLRDAFDTFWRYQNFMFSYHSGLTATHPYQSSWWAWPLTLKPMWYYSGNDAAAGIVSTLTASGNPAVWWVSTFGAIALLLLRVTRRIRPDRAMQVFCIGILANYLPWALVPRCTFIYHFFATVPFILMATVYLLEREEERFAWLSRVKWVWLGLAVLLFALLYPGLSGLPIPAWWGAILKHLPGGALMYGA